MVVLPAPDGPTSATSWPGSATNETSKRTCCPPDVLEHGYGLERGERDLFRPGVPEIDVVERHPGRPRVAQPLRQALSAIIGGRSSTSNTRSKETSAVMTSTCTLDRARQRPVQPGQVMRHGDESSH